MKYSVWFPYPSCWLKAFLLAALTGSVVLVFARIIGGIGEIIVRLSDRPDLYILTIVLVFLSPIPAIALVHFLIHFLLGKLASGLQSPQVQKHPVLMSVWEGLYGWMAISIATAIAMAIIATDLRMLAKQINDPQAVLVCAIWLITTAVLYQVEYLVILLNTQQVNSQE